MIRSVPKPWWFRLLTGEVIGLGLTFSESNIAFSFQTTLDGGFARVGNPTSGGDPPVFNVILNQFDFSDGTDSFGGVNILPNGGTQNVVVTLLVPEPSSLLLLAVGGVMLVSRHLLVPRS